MKISDLTRTEQACLAAYPGSPGKIHVVVPTAAIGSRGI